MKLKMLSAAVCTAVLAAGYAAISGAQTHDAHAGMAAGSQALHQSMEKGQKDMMGMKMTGDADHDFAMMMTSHHKSGVEMAEIELKHGKDPKMKEMARKIIDAQKKEIAEFEAWMKTHKPAAAGHAH